MNMPIEDELKEYIINQYGDVKSFTAQANIPNSTLNTMFSRGILNSNIKSIILVAKALHISVDGLVAGKIIPYIENEKDCCFSKQTTPIQTIYDNLNSAGQQKLIEYAQDLVALDKYKKCDTISDQEIG